MSRPDFAAASRFELSSANRSSRSASEASSSCALPSSKVDDLLRASSSALRSHPTPLLELQGVLRHQLLHCRQGGIHGHIGPTSRMSRQSIFKAPRSALRHWMRPKACSHCCNSPLDPEKRARKPLKPHPRHPFGPDPGTFHLKVDLKALLMLFTRSLLRLPLGLCGHVGLRHTAISPI